MKDLVKVVASEDSTASQGSDEKLHAQLLTQIPVAELSQILKEITSLDKDLTEQDTIGHRIDF